MKRTRQHRLNARGYAALELVVIVVVIAGILGAGVLAYGSYNKAHAGSNTKLGVSTVAGASYTTYACKTYVPTLGGVYRVTVTFAKAASAPSSGYSVGTYQGATVINSQSGSTYTNSTTAQVTTNVAVPQSDQITIYAPGKTYQETIGQIGKFNNC
jgi:hypothetical protein